MIWFFVITSLLNLGLGYALAVYWGSRPRAARAVQPMTVPSPASAEAAGPTQDKPGTNSEADHGVGPAIATQDSPPEAQVEPAPAQPNAVVASQTEPESTPSPVESAAEPPEQEEQLAETPADEIARLAAEYEAAAESSSGPSAAIESETASTQGSDSSSAPSPLEGVDDEVSQPNEPDEVYEQPLRQSDAAVASDDAGELDEESMLRGLEAFRAQLNQQADSATPDDAAIIEAEQSDAAVSVADEPEAKAAAPADVDAPATESDAEDLAEETESGAPISEREAKAGIDAFRAQLAQVRQV